MFVQVAVTEVLAIHRIQVVLMPCELTRVDRLRWRWTRNRPQQSGFNELIQALPKLMDSTRCNDAQPYATVWIERAELRFVDLKGSTDGTDAPPYATVWIERADLRAFEMMDATGYCDAQPYATVWIERAGLRAYRLMDATRCKDARPYARAWIESADF